jgi:hypothetical protein
MRVSDSERQRTIDELGRHLAAGRLDAHDYAQRVEAAAVAVDLAELDALLTDLPMLRIAAPDGARRARPPRVVGGMGRWRAWVVVLVAVVVLAGVVSLAVAAQWVALAVLVGAWALGVLHGRLVGRR